MKKLHIAATDETPEVHFDPHDGSISLRGTSMSEDPMGFYEPLESWMTEFVESAPGIVDAEIHLTYFNSTSAKRIFHLLLQLEDIKFSGGKVHVVWKYNDGDELMQMKGEEIADMLEIPVKLVKAE